MRASILSKQFAVISEIKRASPSAGHIAEIGDPLERAKLYVELGAAAISVLTDAGFNGSMADLRRVTEGLKDSPIPVLCKDFMLTPPQIAEAAANGADVILLIVHVLKEKTLEMAKLAHAFGLEVLVEVHNPNELEIALQANADVIGVNQRDLNDFTMHPDQFAELIRLIPTGVVKVAESGLKTREQALAAIELGYDGVLVGEALSRLANPAEFFGR
jgi:indole-3-glycerol phosphate synthase